MEQSGMEKHGSGVSVYSGCPKLEGLEFYLAWARWVDKHSRCPSRSEITFSGWKEEKRWKNWRKGGGVEEKSWRLVKRSALMENRAECSAFQWETFTNKLMQMDLYFRGVSTAPVPLPSLTRFNLSLTPRYGLHPKWRSPHVADGSPINQDSASIRIKPSLSNVFEKT